MSEEGPHQPAPSERTVKWSVLYARILTALIIAGAASFIAMIVLPAVWADPTSSQSSAEQSVDFAFFTILGCFVGLITGKFT